VTPGHSVIVVGAGAAAQVMTTQLRAAGITDVLTPGEEDVTDAAFDDAANTWTVHSANGKTLQGRVVIAAHRPIFTPWIPELAGREDFTGTSFHAVQPDPDFDPAGKHVAVIGTDATAGHCLAQLVESAASVTVFAHAPRRIVTELPLPMTRIKRWLRRRIGLRTRTDPTIALVGAAIEALTPTGLKTSDGFDHPADAIVYGTGFTVPASLPDETLVGAGGLPLRHSWYDGMEPYVGVAVHGFPNYFFITGPDFATQASYVAECLELLECSPGTRIEVRHSTAQVFNQRINLESARPHRVASAFDLSSGGRDVRETYAGAATLTVDGATHQVRVRLTGHLDPIDGRYHWQGTLFDCDWQPLPDNALKQARVATLTVSGCAASARIVEKTPWGTHSVAGVGAPPYPVRGVELISR